MLNGQESNVANVLLPDQHVNSDCKFKIVMETPEFVPFLGLELLGKTCWCWDKRREKGPVLLVLLLSWCVF